MLAVRCVMNDYAVFEEGMLERIGVTCSGCRTTVTYALSEDLAVKRVTCSYCQRVLLDVVDTCIDPDRGACASCHRPTLIDRGS